jgi:hypothetical protein
MFGLLLVIAAVAIGTVAAVILLVAWAVRREDTGLTMVNPAPGRVTYAVRRLLGLYSTGLAAPAWPDHEQYPADRPEPRGLGPARWDTPVGV